MTFYRKLRVIAQVCAVFLMMTSVANANQACPKFPKVIWWQTSHDQIINYVSQKHGGDWPEYLRKWNSQLEKVKAIYQIGGTAIFRNKGFRLEGEALGRYVEAVEERLQISKCLAHREMATNKTRKISNQNDG